MEKTQAQRYYIRKKQIILKHTSGACSSCGYKKNVAALAFHHEDPATKEFQLSNRALAYRSWESVQAEMAKCILLCQNCHHELHHPLGDWEQIPDEEVDFTRPEKHRTSCSDCGEEVVSTYQAKRCRSCADKVREKAVWPDLPALIEEVRRTSKTVVAQRLGVTRQAVSARIRRRTRTRPKKPVRTCSLCDRKHYAKDLCQKHYQQHRSDGTTDS